MKIPLLLILAIAMLVIYSVVINELYYKRGVRIVDKYNEYDKAMKIQAEYDRAVKLRENELSALRLKHNLLATGDIVYYMPQGIYSKYPILRQVKVANIILDDTYNKVDIHLINDKFEDVISLDRVSVYKGAILDTFNERLRKVLEEVVLGGMTKTEVDRFNFLIEEDTKVNGLDLPYHFKVDVVSRLISAYNKGEDIQNIVDELYEDYKLRG